jgi:hypothetical protein
MGLELGLVRVRVVVMVSQGSQTLRRPLLAVRAPLRILGSVVEGQQGSQGLHPCFPFEGHLEGREQSLKQGINKARSVRTEVKKKGASWKRAGLGKK